MASELEEERVDRWVDAAYERGRSLGFQQARSAASRLCTEKAKSVGDATACLLILAAIEISNLEPSK